MTVLQAQFGGPRSVAKAHRLGVVASNSCNTIGGLAAYQGNLLRELSTQWPVFAAARFDRKAPPKLTHADSEPSRLVDNGGFQTHIFGPVSAYKPLLTQAARLTARSATRRAGMQIYLRAYTPGLDAALPEALDIVHYIGVGWELLGYAALECARRRSAAFTIWPAVHPHIWGDGSLDVDLYRQADLVFAQTPFERDYLIELGLNAHRIATCGLAPACPPTGNAARFRDEHGLGHRPIVLFVGRKTRDKGYHALRQSMAAIVDHVPDCCLVAIGPDAEPPFPRVAEGNFLDLGATDNVTKADALAACDVVCVPSRAEAFGIVYVEAWSYGKPVIGGPAPALRDLIEDGRNGLRVEQDPVQIASAVVRLLHDKSFAEAMGQSGRRLQEREYTWGAVAERHKSAFESAASAASIRYGKR